jgi:DnaJ-class molecular chaperone
MIANRGLPLTAEFDGLVQICGTCGGSGMMLSKRSAAFDWAGYRATDLCPTCHGRAFVIITDRRRPRWEPAPLV